MIRDSTINSYVLILEDGTLLRLNKELYSLEYVTPSRNFTIMCSFKRVGVNDVDTYICLNMYCD